MAEERNIALSGDAPKPTQDERRMLQFLDRLEQESVSVEKTLRSNWGSNLAWYRGQQWTVRNREPLFMANKIANIVQRKAAKLTEMKPQLMVTSRREKLMTTAQVLQKTIEAGWDEYGMQAVLSDLAYHLEVFGCGVLHLCYDPQADHGAGDIVPSIVDPRFFHMDPAIRRAQDSDKAAFQWTSSVMTLWEIRKRWPAFGLLVSADAIEKESEQSVDARIERMFPGGGYNHAAVAEAIPRAIVKEYWFHDPTLGDDSRPRYPAGRRVIRAGDVILKDEPNPYFHRRWPYVLIDATPDPDHPWGQSEVQGLKRMQNAVNRVGHLFVSNTILTGNTWVTADQNALKPTTKQRLSNIGAVLIEKLPGRSVTREAPPPMPPHMLGFVEMAMALMDELSGLADTTVSTQGRVEVRSEGQLEGLQQAAETILRATSRRIELGLERLGQRWVAAIFQFYTRDRTLAFLGPTQEWETFEFERETLLHEIEQATSQRVMEDMEAQRMTRPMADMQREAQERAWEQFLFKITPGSSLASVRAARAMLHGQLAEKGLISPTQVLRDLGYSNPEEEIERALREGAALAMAKGGGEDQATQASVRRAM